MQSSPLPSIGSKIPFPNSHDSAILKYVGSVHGHDGVFCGLELCGNLASKGKNNGIVDGVQYFNVDIPNSGLFVPLRKVVGWISQTGNSMEPFSPMSVNDRNSFSSVDNTLMNSNNEVVELKKYITVLEKRLLQRDTDIKEMSIQVDELDANIRANEARLNRKETKFENFKKEKDEEIAMLISTIETLERKLQTDRVKELEQILKDKEREFQEFKQLKDNEVEQLKAILANATNTMDNIDLNKAYVPPQPIDPSAGRDNFCTYCDREGHTTSDCPYQKDSLEMF